MNAARWPDRPFTEMREAIGSMEWEEIEESRS